jgi:TrwC relaxase
LTRQVAALDSTEKGHTGLASYYPALGETPGVWVGSGLDGIDGLTVGDPVTAEQMRALFGCGLHPLADLLEQQLEGPDSLSAITWMRPGSARRSRSLTATSTRSDSKWPNAWWQSIRRRRCRPQIGPGCGPRWAGVLPRGAWPGADGCSGTGWANREDSRPQAQTVPGYDLTFSPVKSVSTLWAVADPALAAMIERAHQAAVKDALVFIEKHALFTRTRPQGIRQVNVGGLVGTAFTHRDSRARGPDLHTPAADRLLAMAGGPHPGMSPIDRTLSLEAAPPSAAPSRGLTGLSSISSLRTLA